MREAAARGAFDVYVMLFQWIVTVTEGGAEREEADKEGDSELGETAKFGEE